jgi:hypothetical protein
MNKQTVGARLGACLLLIFLALTLAGCGNRLPSEVQDTLLASFDPDERPRIHSATQVEPLAVDIAAGAEEVWCVNITFECFTSLHYGRGERTTCGESRLARLIDGGWRVSRVITSEDEANWTARGCELMEPIVALP